MVFSDNFGDSMKIIKVMAIIALVFNAVAAQAKCSGVNVVTNLSLQRYTDVGGGKVRFEGGILYVKQGYVPIGSSDLEMTTLGITPDVLAQVNGQPVVELAKWIALDIAIPGGNGSTFLCNYSRSAATYSIDNVPHVIVSVKQATVKKPKVSISAVDPSASETAGDSGQFLITLNAPSAKTIRVKLQTSGKAKNNRDYTGVPKTVVIPSGNVSAIVEVSPIDDTSAEGPEDVKVKVSSGGNAYSALGGRRGTASVIINDND